MRRIAELSAREQECGGHEERGRTRLDPEHTLALYYSFRDESAALEPPARGTAKQSTLCYDAQDLAESTNAAYTKDLNLEDPKTARCAFAIEKFP